MRHNIKKHVFNKETSFFLIHSDVRPEQKHKVGLSRVEKGSAQVFPDKNLTSLIAKVQLGVNRSFLWHYTDRTFNNIKTSTTLMWSALKFRHISPYSQVWMFYYKPQVGLNLLSLQIFNLIYSICSCITPGLKGFRETNRNTDGNLQPLTFTAKYNY